MKRFLVAFLNLLLSTSLVFADDELKLYGIISYLANDQTELHIDDLVVHLDGAEIEGFLTLGALIEVEGYWQEKHFIAEEVEVQHSAQSNVFIFRGQVLAGKLLGLEFPSLTEGSWLELVTQQQADASLSILLIKKISPGESALQASVEELTETGFVAGGVRVISKQTVQEGDLISVRGHWANGFLVSEP